jgi:hypothetical protein
MPIKHFDELDFSVIAEPSTYHVDFKIYEIVGVFDDGQRDFSGETDIKEAEVFLSGSVKWDGCSNWTFDEQDRGVMIHGCDKNDLLRIGKIMAECWEWTKELCEKWDGDF